MQFLKFNGCREPHRRPAPHRPYMLGQFAEAFVPLIVCVAWDFAGGFVFEPAVAA